MAAAIGNEKGGADCCSKGERMDGRLRAEAIVGADERADKSTAEGPNKDETTLGWIGEEKPEAADDSCLGLCLEVPRAE